MIGGTIFPHKNIHKGTWVSPDHVTVNQIDHICICKKFRRSMLDVRVKRAADVASDHHLVVTRLRLKLKRNWSGHERRKAKYNVNLLRDSTTIEKYKLELSNRYQVLQELLGEEEEEASIDREWTSVKDALNKTCEEVLGRKKQQQKEWISAETCRKVQARKEKKAAVNNSRTRAGKAAAQEEYSAANREVKRSVRQDKRDFVEQLAKEAEEAAGSRNMKQLYDTTKKLSGKYRQADRPVKDKDGKTLMGTDQQL